MRLTREEIDAIKAAAREAFGAGAVVRLFGSRVHDHLRGGDIDLHVEADEEDVLRRRETDFRVSLSNSLDEEPIDVVVHTAGTPPRWIDRVAFRDGIVL